MFCFVLLFFYLTLHIRLDKPGCFESTLDMCDSSSYNCTGNSGIITSPNFPNLMQERVDCTWDIRTPQNSFIVLNFTESWKRSDCECDSASVRIVYPGFEAPVVEKYCGDNFPPNNTIESYLNYVQIDFQSKDPDTIAFKIEYEAKFYPNPVTNRSNQGEH